MRVIDLGRPQRPPIELDWPGHVPAGYPNYSPLSRPDLELYADFQSWPLGFAGTPADATPLSQVTDLSGHGRHLTQATPANQPLWREAGANRLTRDMSMGADDTDWQLYNLASMAVDGSVPVAPAVGSAVKMTPSGPVGHAIATDHIPVTVGADYTFSAYVLSEAAGASAQIALHFYDTSDAEVGSTYSDPIVASDAAWTRGGVTAAAPDDAAYARVEVGDAPSTVAAIWWSRMQVEAHDAATGWIPGEEPAGAQFDGVNDALSGLATPDWAEKTVYIVANALGGAQRPYWMHRQRPDSNGEYHGAALYRWDANNSRLYVYYPATSGAFISAGSYPYGSAAIVTSTMSSTHGLATYTNGELTDSNLLTYSQLSSPTNLNVGAGGMSGTDSLNGLIHQFIIFSTVHNDPTRQQIESWLAARTGITLT